jgi:hypothetical protein
MSEPRELYVVSIGAPPSWLRPSSLVVVVED